MALLVTTAWRLPESGSINYTVTFRSAGSDAIKFSTKLASDAITVFCYKLLVAFGKWAGLNRVVPYWF